MPKSSDVQVPVRSTEELQQQARTFLDSRLRRGAAKFEVYARAAQEYIRGWSMGMEAKPEYELPLEDPNKQKIFEQAVGGDVEGAIQQLRRQQQDWTGEEVYTFIRNFDEQVGAIVSGETNPENMTPKKFKKAQALFRLCRVLFAQCPQAHQPDQADPTCARAVRVGWEIMENELGLEKIARQARQQGDQARAQKAEEHMRLIFSPSQYPDHLQQQAEQAYAEMMGYILALGLAGEDQLGERAIPAPLLEKLPHTDIEHDFADMLPAFQHEAAQQVARRTTGPTQKGRQP